ncbi:MAG TPA: VWA domain-containing protein [Pseudonocardiaceae bacterium]|nr:VWA domain-containing protein [Pseudonocardiaceae bacterium]
MSTVASAGERSPNSIAASRGAVVLIVSDGRETGDPAHLAEQMAKLSRVAHRIVWANPRVARPG